MAKRIEWLTTLGASDLGTMPPWMFVTSRQLAKALGVHLQTLANWRVREVGPTPAPTGWFKGRPARYYVGHVWMWAYEQAGQRITPVDLNAAWLRDHMAFAEWEDLAAVRSRVQLLMKLGKEFRPQELTRAGREGLELTDEWAASNRPTV